MNSRFKVISAAALMIVGGAIVAVSYSGSLQAEGVAATGYDPTKLLVWAGGITLVISAILFLSASSR